MDRYRKIERKDRHNIYSDINRGGNKGEWDKERERRTERRQRRAAH